MSNILQPYLEKVGSSFNYIGISDRPLTMAYFSWFVFLSIFNMAIFFTIYLSELRNRKILLFVDITRNIICILPLVYSKFFYLFYDELIFGQTIYSSLTYIELIMVVYYGILDRINRNNNLDRADYSASYFHLSKIKREKKC